MRNNSISKKDCFKTKLSATYTPFIFVAVVYSKNDTNNDYTVRYVPIFSKLTYFIYSNVLKDFQ